MNEITVGSTVKYNNGFYRVSRKTKNTVNLAGIFTSKIHYKSVPISEVTYAYEEWEKHWTASETYMSM